MYMANEYVEHTCVVSECYQTRLSKLSLTCIHPASLKWLWALPFRKECLLSSKKIQCHSHYMLSRSPVPWWQASCILSCSILKEQFYICFCPFLLSWKCADNKEIFPRLSTLFGPPAFCWYFTSCMGLDARLCEMTLLLLVSSESHIPFTWATCSLLSVAETFFAEFAELLGELM